MSFKVEVLAYGEKKYCSNALRFGTKGEAEKSGESLFQRWFAVDKWRVVESDDEANYVFKDGLGDVRLIDA
jgi:hypothetical protein